MTVSLNSYLANKAGGFTLFRYFLLGAFCLFFSSNIWGQDMESTNQAPITPENLITNYFLGDGVEVVSLTHNGDPSAVAFFKNGLEEIGIDRGIVLSTGFANSPNVTSGLPATGPAAGSNVFLTQDLPNDGNTFDADLDAISTVPINDVTVYTIQFIPTSDTLRFKYVFASEEYPGYTCSTFNDVFGFFISGPGINGPLSNNGKNIALVPGTDLPVAINTVNSGMSSTGNIGECAPPNGSLDYAQYFVNNQGTGNQPVYDGLTTVLTAEAVVVPCEIYTIKLAIADGGDSALDSGVFLEAKSFGTGSLDVQAATVSLDGSVAEGCAEGTLTVSLPNPLTTDYVVDYNILGDAINGVDYETIPDNLTIPAGETELIIPIIAIEDGIDEGPETLIIDIKKNICARDTIHLVIKDNPLEPIELRPDTTICPNDSLLLDGTIDIPLPEPLTFTNNTPLSIPDPDLNTGIQNPVYSDIEVFGVLPATLGEDVIASVCINDLQHNWDDDLDIFLLSPGGQFIELTTDNGGSGNDFIQTCFTLDATTIISSPGPVAPTSAAPFTGDWLPEGVWSDLWDGGDYPTNGTWQLQLIDDGQGFSGTLNEWSITFKPTYEIKYEWTPTAGLSCPTCPETMANPQETTTYTVVATDSYGCTETADVTIGVSPTPDHSPVLIQGVTCADGADGQATVEITGGAGPFTFNWPDDMQTDSIGINLSGGTHPVQFGDGSGCIYTTEVEIPIPDALETEITGTDVSCNGDASGEISATTQGGTAPYAYEWNNAATTETITGIAAGSYSVTVTDDNDCTTTADIDIMEAPQLFVDAIATPTDCFAGSNGVTTAVAQGGSGNFMYDWYDASGTLITQAASATGLEAGIYQCIATDIAGCKDTVEVEVISPTELEATSQETDVLCFGDTNGQSTLQVQGGTPNYVYAWSDMGASVPNRTDLAAGTHSVIITDDNGCEEVVSVTIGTPDALESTSTMTDISCFAANDGQASVVPIGGIIPYTYNWDNNQDTPDATDLTPGIHTVTVTDGNDCTHEVQVTIAEPDELVVTPTPTDLTCFESQNGSINITTAGGTAGYNHAWDSGHNTASINQLSAGTYVLTTTDDNNCTVETTVTLTEPAELTSTTSSTLAGCNDAENGTATVTVQGGVPTYDYIWDNGETTATASSMTGGDHSVTVTDDNNCEHIATVFVDGTPNIELTHNQVDIPCFGDDSGAISVTATGGIGSNYSYEWNTGQTTPSLSNLEPGTYTLMVTDPVGCEASTTIEITEATQINMSSAIEDVLCADEATGAISVSVNGGTTPYTYSWSNGAGQALNNNLTQGSYTLTMVDANGCLHTQSYEVDAPSAITIDLDPIHIDCYGESTGELSSQIGGGIPPYNYSWSTGQNNNAPLENLAAGTYTLSILDANGCLKEATQEVIQPLAPMAADVSQEDISCNGGHDGLILVEATGGTAPYQYSLDNTNFNGSPQQIGLEADTYRVFVRDAKGCMIFIDDIVVNEPAEIDVDLGPNVELNYTDSHVLNPTITSTNPIVTYEWTPNDPTLLDCFDCISPTVTTDHQVSIRLQVTDENGCTGEDYINIYVKKDFGIYVPTGFTPNGDGNNDVLIVHGIPGAVVNSFRIFDRWGELLFENVDFDVNTPATGWNGMFREENMNSGTYIWHIEATLPDGNKVSLHGSSNLIR